MAVLPKVIYRVSVIPIKIPMTFFFPEIENLSENSYGLSKDPQITKTILKKSRSGGLTLFYLKTYYNVRGIKTVCTV